MIGDGFDYRGAMRQTASGYRCQFWTKKVPNDQNFEGLRNHNECRNPDGESGPWCYTEYKHRRWESCEIRACGECDTGIKVNDCQETGPVNEFIYF